MIAVVLIAVASACGGAPSASSVSPSASAKASPAGGPSKLDPEVAMPADFPSDVPIYPGSRLTAGAKFPTNGKVDWGMEWETLDGVDKVHAFFASKLSQGDWTIQFSGATGTSFSAVFTRKSNDRSTGIVGADGSSGVTKISMSLVNA